MFLREHWEEGRVRSGREMRTRQKYAINIIPNETIKYASHSYGNTITNKYNIADSSFGIKHNSVYGY